VPDKYNIKVNRPQPTEAEIDQHKDFGRVLAQYRRRQKSRSLHDTVARLNKHIPVLVLVLVLAMLIVYFAKLMRRRPQPAPRPASSWVVPTPAYPAVAATCPLAGALACTPFKYGK
jgi:hypothetical protein